MLGPGSGASMVAMQLVSWVAAAVQQRMPPTASYGCEVWGLRVCLSGTAAWAGPRWPPRISSFRENLLGSLLYVHTSSLLRELGQCTLEHLWWRRAIRFFNTLATHHDGFLFRQNRGCQSGRCGA